MSMFKKIDETFAALGFREQVLAAAAVVVCLALAGNAVLIKPQLLKINNLKATEEGHRKELSKLKEQLDVIRAENNAGIDPFAKEKEQLAFYSRQIAEAESFVGKENSGVSQVGVLVRGLIRANPGLRLVSLKTLKPGVFYSPPKKEKKSAVVSATEQALSKLQNKNAVAQEELAFVDKTLYKHGIEVVVNGTYPALISYLNEMQKFPKRIFWSESHLDASNFRSANLKLVLLTVSDQEVSPIE